MKNSNNSDMNVGFVKWFSYEKGYGVIEDIDDGKEFFCHIKDLNRSVAIRLDQDTLVFYTPSFDEKRKRNTTHSIKLIENIDDLRSVLFLWAEKYSGISSKNVFFVSAINLFLQKSESSSDKFINEESFNELVNLLIDLSSVVDYYVSLINIIRKAVSIRYKADKAAKLIEMIEVKLIGELPDRIVSEINEEGFSSIYASLFFCILYPFNTEKNVVSLFSKNEFHAIFENLCRLIADINGEPNASIIKENNKLLTQTDFFKDLAGSQLLFAVNRIMYEKLDAQKIIQLYKEGYVTEISPQYINQHVEDLLFYDFQLLFDDFQIGKNDKLEILKNKICKTFITNDVETVWKYWDYGQEIAEDKAKWFADMSKILEEQDNLKFNDFKINSYILGKWINYDEEFVCSNIGKYSTNDLSNIVERYTLSDDQIEKLYLYDVKYILTHGPKDYILARKNSPWGYDFYEEIKKVYSQVPRRDWIPLNSDFLYQTGEKYVDLIIRLYKDGLFYRLNDGFVIYYLDEISVNDIIDILSNENVEANQKTRILKESFFKVLRSLSQEKTSSLKCIMDESHSLLDNEWKEWYEEVVEDCSEEELFFLWKEKITETCPYNYIKDCLLNSNKKCYEEFYGYYCNGMISKEKAKELLWLNIKSEKAIDNREEFYKRLYSIKYLLLIDDSEIEHVKEIEIDIYMVFLWYLSYTTEFKFEVLAKKFIYFDSSDQVRIIKGLFYLADKGNLSLTVEMLESIVRVDSDLYRLISQNHPFVPIDVSTDIVIKALANLYRKGNFSSDKDVLNIIINASQYTKKERIKIGSYFDECPGRLSYKRDKAKTALGKISMLNSEMYAVTVVTSITVQAYSQYYGRYDKNTNNPEFQNIVNAIKTLQGSRWNPTSKIWEVPASNKEKLFEIAKQYGLIIEGQWNYHMFTYKRETEGRPSGINYCEGRPSITSSKVTDTSFLWCRNQECHQKAVECHDAGNWEEYTLLDFCRILGLETDTQDQKGRIVKYGKYLSFTSLINRANSILEHLYCRECEEMLEPVEISNYYTHLVTKFHCTNPQCNKFHESIYISKCFNWKCHGVIDERDNKKCPNNWIICPVCGSCCSNRIVAQRINNRLKLGLGPAPYLQDFINMKMGHLEKREFYCYKCGNKMESNGGSLFVCRTCGVEYNRQPFDYEVRYASSNNSYDEYDDIF